MKIKYKDEDKLKLDYKLVSWEDIAVDPTKAFQRDPITFKIYKSGLNKANIHIMLMCDSFNIFDINKLFNVDTDTAYEHHMTFQELNEKIYEAFITDNILDDIVNISKATNSSFSLKDVILVRETVISTHMHKISQGTDFKYFSVLESVSKF